MKDLNTINPAVVRPDSLSALSGIIPIISGSCGIALASGAAPQIPFDENLISITCALFVAIGLFMISIPKIFRWDWKAKYFGSGLICLGAAALFGIVPWLCVVFFSRMSVIPRAVIFVAYFSMIVWWCLRFVRAYQKIYADKTLMQLIYEEEDDAVYYLQKSDKWAIEKKIRLNQAPHIFIFIITFVIAILMLPFMRAICSVVGVPPTHIFLLVSAIPLVLLSLGFATRGYLIFYHYPRIIKKTTGKDVYIDMVKDVKKPKRNARLST